MFEPLQVQFRGHSLANAAHLKQEKNSVIKIILRNEKRYKL